MRNKSHNSMKTTLHSSYWLDDFSIGSLKSRSELDPIELAKYQRVISNFVQILTKQRIPVEYKTNGNSYTDSKSIVIGSNISEKTFDSVVGLALHEGSHIKLTDFTILPNLIGKIRELGHGDFVDSVPFNFEISEMVRGILNYIEDRRIDYYVYTNSPGYKNYYKALYDRYFNHSSINKGLKSNEFRDSSDIQSYIFRIINLTNSNSDLDALPGLREIYNLIFSNVRNLNSTMDSLDITVQVCKVILDNVNSDTNDDESESTDSNNEDSQSGEDSGKSASGEESNDSGENSPSNEGESGEGSSQSDDSSDGEGDNNSNGPEKLSDKQQKQLQKDIQKQKDFLNGSVSKRGVNKKMKEEINAVALSDIELVDVGYEHKLYNGETLDKTHKVVVMRGLNENTLGVLGYFKIRYKNYNMYRGPVDAVHSIVMDGISLGKRLGKKLQVRNYENNTTINRQKKGRIERRRLHAIGADDFNVFYQVQTEKYTDAFLHLSIDGSGSMSGNNFFNSLKSAVAIAQMGTMTNIDVQISLRLSGVIGGTERPIMWIVYDSRKDTMATIKRYFKFLDVCGCTPEGLCFNSIMEELPVGSDSLKTYFINYSDGEPYFQSYTGESALNHTRKQVNKMKENGYKVLSFFITNYSNSSVSNNFKKMYGEDSKNIDPTSLPKLVNTLQKMFVKNK